MLLEAAAASLHDKEKSSFSCVALVSGYYAEPNNQQHYGWVPASGPNNATGKKFYQPHNFNRPTPGPLAYKPSKNPYR